MAVSASQYEQLAAMGWCVHCVIGGGSSGMVLSIEWNGENTTKAMFRERPTMFDLQLKPVACCSSIALKLFHPEDRYCQQAVHEASVLSSLQSKSARQFVPRFFGMLSLVGPVQVALGIERLTCSLRVLTQDPAGMSTSTRALPFAMAFRLSSQVVQAIISVHREGWVHGDIKLSNLMWCAETARVKMVDFGLSNQVETDSDGPLRDWQATGAALSQLFGSTVGCTKEGADASEKPSHDVQTGVVDVLQMLANGNQQSPDELLAQALNGTSVEQLARSQGFMWDVSLVRTPRLLLLNVLALETDRAEDEEVLGDVINECEQFGGVTHSSIRSYGDARLVCVQLVNSENCEHARQYFSGKTFDLQPVHAFFGWDVFVSK